MKTLNSLRKSSRPVIASIFYCATKTRAYGRDKCALIGNRSARLLDIDMRASCRQECALMGRALMSHARLSTAPLEIQIPRVVKTNVFHSSLVNSVCIYHFSVMLTSSQWHRFSTHNSQKRIKCLCLIGESLIFSQFHFDS